MVHILNGFQWVENVAFVSCSLTILLASHEALKLIHDRNTGWSPSSFIADFCEAEVRSEETRVYTPTMLSTDK